MKKVIKHNKRNKAFFGLLLPGLIMGALSAAGSVAGSAIQANRLKKQAEANRRQQQLMANQENAMTAQINEQQAINYDKNNELETLKTNDLNTITSEQSQFRCGGKRRMKKVGGCIVDSIRGISRYI